MKKQKGEVVLGVVLVGFVLGVIASVAVPTAYYDNNKADVCPDNIQDTTKELREYCYAEKSANDIGMTLTEK